VHRYSDQKVGNRRRLRRIAGQVRGIQTMIDEDRAGTSRLCSTSSSSVLSAVLFWMARNCYLPGGAHGYAIDPVCGMQVRRTDAPAKEVREGRRCWFCSDHCRARSSADGRDLALAGVSSE
jgi:YHS domain-containing protein